MTDYAFDKADVIREKLKLFEQLEERDVIKILADCMIIIVEGCEKHEIAVNSAFQELANILSGGRSNE